MYIGAALLIWGAALLNGVQRSSAGCGVDQLIVRRLALRQARVRFSSRHPMEASLAERSSDENTRWRPSANGEG